MLEWRQSLKQGQSLAFAPTMGNLHAGHLALVENGKQHCDKTIASIYVNPMQFGTGEDLDNYPRTIDSDLEKLERLGTDAVFMPSTHDIYPDGLAAHTSVDVPDLTTVLCGASRPGHFRGMTTVVSKLLGIVRPDKAIFGRKDLQQVLVIEKMVRDLMIPTKIVSIATSREADGLAMSSRNCYLSDTERRIAPKFYKRLCECVGRINQDRTALSDAIRGAKAALRTDGFVIDYLEARRTYDLSLTTLPDQSAIFGAVFLGETRLIDNISLDAAAGP
jgi:pantoate--beta-alanine ligase